MNDIVNEKLGAWLLQDGHSRALLAKELGISRAVLNKRLRGITKWSWNEVIQVSRLTNCSLNELAGLPAA